MELNVDFSKMTSGELKGFMTELKLRAMGSETHYRGEIDPKKPRYKSGEAAQLLGLMGNESGFVLSKDIENKYNFISEYKMLYQEFSYLGYRLLKEGESIDPSAVSNLLTFTLEKRRALEDRIMKLGETVNTVLQSLLRMIYELKELDRNLSFYDKAKSKEPTVAEAAELAIKRIFLDNVDSRKGQASLLSMSRSASSPQGGPGFVTLVSDFMALKSLANIKTLQRNEQIKNVLKNRFIEYEDWKKLNETDLRNRRSLMLQYLKSQKGSFNLYSEWLALYMNLLRRAQVAKQQTPMDYIKNVKRPDIMELADFSIELIGFKEVYLNDYDVTWKKLLSNRGMMVPIDASLKTPGGEPVTRGRESERRFTYNRLRKYGPKVIAAIEAKFGFQEKQTFAKGLPQQQASQYEGTLNLQIMPYCFTLEEWYLFQKAQEEYIKKTVFENVDAVAISSLNAIKKDLEHYVAEAEKETKEEKKKKEPLALLEIYQAFKEDFLGITKYVTDISGAVTPEAVPSDLYEIAVNHRIGRTKMHDAVKVGLFVAGSQADLMFEEYKRRFRFLNAFSPFDVF